MQNILSALEVNEALGIKSPGLGQVTAPIIQQQPPQQHLNPEHYIQTWNNEDPNSAIFRHKLDAWFKTLLFKNVTSFTRMEVGNEYKSQVLRTKIVTSLIPEKIMPSFLEDPIDKKDGFRMWGRLTLINNLKGPSAQ